MAMHDATKAGQLARFRFDVGIANVQTLKATLLEMSDTGIFPTIGKRLDDGIAGMIEMMRDSRPYSSCPDCNGRGNGCDCCGYRGWLCKLEWEALDAKPKSKAMKL